MVKDVACHSASANEIRGEVRPMLEPPWPGVLSSPNDSTS